MAILAVAAQQGVAIHLGEHQVEHQQIVVARLGEIEALLAVTGNIHRIAGALPQSASQIFRQAPFVFDH